MRNIILYPIIQPWTAVAVPLLRLDTHLPGGFGSRALAVLQFLDEFGRIPPERTHFTARPRTTRKHYAVKIEEVTKDYEMPQGLIEALMNDETAAVNW